jgi:hypothetical protein
MLGQVRQGLVAALDDRLVDELLAAHQEAKRNYYLGGLRLSAVEGGRFCEAAFRLLMQITTGAFDALGTPLDTEKLVRALGSIPQGRQPDSVRLHLPRALRVVYDIRNKRDNAHLADGIDPNLQDAGLVVAVLDWVLAEFVRLYHSVPANTAQEMVAGIVTRCAPAMEDFGGFLKVLRTDLGVSDFVMLLLYQRGSQGAAFTELESWVRPKMRANLRRTLAALADDKAFIHADDGAFQITRSGQNYVEAKKLMEVAP